MDTKVIRCIVELASRAPMSNYERLNFNRDAQLILAECEKAEQPPKEKENVGEQGANV